MLGWLRKKVQPKSDEEYKKGIKRNSNFLKFAEAFKDNSDQLKQDLISVDASNAILNMSSNSSENMDKLLKLDMICRRMFAQEYGGSDLKYNKEFDPK